MQAMAPPRPTELQHRRIQLAADPRAAAEAREQVREAIAVWDVPVDAETASLLASELVTNAVTHDGSGGSEGSGGSGPDETGPGGAGSDNAGPGGVGSGGITMAIRVAKGRLRVDVHDTSTALPEPVRDAPPDAETGRGLLLVDTLADEWGFYRTPGGKAVYFSLAFRK